MGFKCNSFDDLTKIIFFVGPLGFHAIEKIAQHLQVRTHHIRNPHPQVDQNPLKTLCMSKTRSHYFL